MLESRGMSFVSKNLSKLRAKAVSRIERQANKALDFWYDYLLEKFKEPKHGTEYTHMIGGRTYNWIASAPGEFPALVTGDLLTTPGILGTMGDRGYPRSLHRYVNVGGKMVTIHIKLTIPYAIPLEAKRPLLAQSRIDCKDEILKILTAGK